MTNITTKDLIQAVATATGSTLTVAGQHVEATLAAIQQSIVAGSPVVLKGIGTLSTAVRAARNGVNPSTSQPIVIPETKVVKFKVTAPLKAAVKGQ